MTSQTEKAKVKLATLFTSFDDLEAHLEPLFAHTLPETLIGLEPIQQAKLQAVLPYLVYDLVFSACLYLKSRGIDPKTHPVVPELDRVKQYFDKITAAENPPQKRAEIDKAAAGRFIKHAIVQATHAKPPTDDYVQPEPSTSALARIPAKVTSKMLERQQYEKELKEQDDAESEEEELAVFGDDDISIDMPSSVLTSASKGKGKEVPKVVHGPNLQPRSKQKRPTIDPFAGYGDDLLKTSTSPTKESRLENPKSSVALSSRSSALVPQEETQTKRGKKRARDGVDSPSDTPKRDDVANLPASKEGSASQNSSTPATVDAKRAKKTKKKARKSLTTSA